MDDNGIIEMYFARNEEAVRETASKYGAYCATIARNILGNAQEEEECVNDVYFRAWSSIPPTRPRSLRAYLARLTRNAALNRIRSRNAQKRGGGFEAASEELSDIADAYSVEEEFDAAVLAELINKFLAALPRDKRLVFMGRYWYFDSVKNIAAKTGFTQSKVNMTLSRTRAELKEFLEKEDIYL